MHVVCGPLASGLPGDFLRMLIPGAWHTPVGPDSLEKGLENLACSKILGSFSCSLKFQNHLCAWGVGEGFEARE